MSAANDEYLKELRRHLKRTKKGTRAHKKVQSEIKRITREQKQATRRRPHVNGGSAYNGHFTGGHGSARAYRTASYERARARRNRDFRNIAIGIGAMYVGTGIYASQHPKEPAKTKKELKRKQTAASIGLPISLGGMGGAYGSTFGPRGGVIGAGLGVSVGISTARQENERMHKEYVTYKRKGKTVRRKNPKRAGKR